MGEARRRAKLREAARKLLKSLSRSRFNIYAIGTRSAMARYMSEELSWWSSLDERLIACTARDLKDNDFLWIILARDRNGCFRCAKLKTDYRTQWHAEEALHFAIAEAVEQDDIESFGLQGDETNAPIDLLQLPTDHDPETLHPYFRALLESPAREPARAVIREIGPWLAPSDPHLVGEFQTKGFDQRIWEIYLWAAFKEFSLDVDQLEAPDFRCQGPGIDFTVEATTVSPSSSGALAQHPEPKSMEETKEFLEGYMPIKFGSALTSKLNKTNSEGKHYWEREESKGKPFLLAIADFHKPADDNEIGSMIYTQSALWQYLYGERVFWKYEGDQLIIEPQKIEAHRFGKKSVPSGFFDLPLAENISAVLFSNAGTLAKFDRMGVVGGFGAAGHKYFRIGLKYNPDPNAVSGIPFTADVSAMDYEEYWTQEIQVFHNPNAKHPLGFEALLGATHNYVEEGMLKSDVPSDAVLSSFTAIISHPEKP